MLMSLKNPYTKEDNSNITSMLGKIESLLNNKPSSSTENKTLLMLKVKKKEEEGCNKKKSQIFKYCFTYRRYK